jgi:hypothetical protein
VRLHLGQRRNPQTGAVEFDPAAIPSDVSELTIGFFRSMDQIEPEVHTHSLPMGVKRNGCRISLQFFLTFLVHIEDHLFVDHIRKNGRHAPFSHTMTGYCDHCKAPLFYFYLDQNEDVVLVRVHQLCACEQWKEILRPTPCAGGMNFWGIDFAKTFEALKREGPVYSEAFSRVAQWTNRQHRLNNQWIWEWLRPRAYSASAQRLQKLAERHCNTLEDFIDHLGGT